MIHSLKTKLILTYAAVALVTITIVVLVVRTTSDQSLMRMVVDQQVSDLSSAVQKYYRTNGDLNGFFEYYMRTTPAQELPFQQMNFPQMGMSGMMRGLIGLVDANNVALFPMSHYFIGEQVDPNLVIGADSVKVNGEVIAWIIRDKATRVQLSLVEIRYVQRTNLAIVLAAGAGILTAIILGVLLAVQLLRPIRRLTAASATLAQGGFGQQIPVTSRDELGQLTQSFNQMSTELARSDEERKHLTADITHDLSTPLQIISGYVEMLEDGEVTLTPERLNIIKTEIEHLRRMVGDLTTISQAEGGMLEIQRSPIDPAQLLETVYHAFEPISAHQGVNLILDSRPNESLINVDEGRFIQILKNLVDNALRYTPAGGSITLSSQVKDKVELRVTDTGSGIEKEDLPFVFDRFYQADQARTTSKGKMGLGLAICKALADAQGCQIRAESGGKNLGTSIVISIEKYNGAFFPEPGQYLQNPS